MPTQFEKTSYSKHASEFSQYAEGMKFAELAKTWFDEDTVDAWRHGRMYANLDPVLQADPGARWLTVGDGRYGNDAHYLASRGAQALATNISADLLREALDAGHIEEYSTENAESLSFDDLSFDYALCKEAYHHFPRPMVALYEMLRVTRKGVFLIEPNDSFIPRNCFSGFTRDMKGLLNWVLFRKKYRHEYEESGNYVFRISEREIEKVALGLDYRCVAFKGMNDAFLGGVESEKVADRGPIFRKIRALIAARNLLCRLRLMDYGLMTALILKEAPSPVLAQSLKEAGFSVFDLPPNPYA